jgi:hypothetical protein
MVFKKYLLPLGLGAVLASVPFAWSNVPVNLQGASFQDSAGLDVAQGTLFQLVNLGPNGVFDPINVADGSTAGLTQWVSGDDLVINVSTGNADFTTTAAFDLTIGADSPGSLSRFFDIDTAQLPLGTKFGVRWFPGLLASNFGSITLAPNQLYGEFTRQLTGSSIAAPALRPNDNAYLYNGIKIPGFDAWVMASKFQLDLDPLSSDPGNDPASITRAGRVVIPEPATLALSFAGFAAVLGLRRRRRA